MLLHRAHAAVLACCIIAATLSGQARAVSEECASCIRPVPLPAPPRFSEEENLKMIQCHLGCISEQHIPIQILNQDTVWPSHAFSTLSCATRQKVNDCTLGCMTSHRTPELTVNQCRQECVSECEGSVSSDAECVSTCRRTFCRFGCSMHSSYSTLQSDTPSASPTPLAAPVLNRHMSSSNTGKLFTVDLTEALPGQHAGSSDAADRQSEPAQNVSYLFRVQQGSNTTYLWQKDILVPLDLSAFACGQIQVSFAVVSLSGSSQFSPALSMCVDGAGGWPSQVEPNSISITYTEDTRQDYLGYAVANISWTRPQNHQYLTSYTIYIHTKTRDCGRPNALFTYSNINKDATWFTVSTAALNGLLKFGCSYTLSVVPMPEQPDQITTVKDLTPDLAEPEPHLLLQCTRLWDKRGFMNISVEWSLTGSSPLPAIRRFSVTPLLIDTRRPGLFGRLREYSRHNINSQAGKTEYSALVTDLSPQNLQPYKYKIEVRVERGDQYLWRRVPSMKTCTVSAHSEPPSTMTDISATSVETRELPEGQLGLQFELTWSPPSSANGILTEYEVAIGTQPVSAEAFLYHSTFPEGQFSAVVNTTFLHNASIHCLHVMMRSFNDYVWSEWSEPLTIALDSHCFSTTDTLPEEDSISVFYQRLGEEAVRIAELSCSSSTHDLVPESISDRLHRLEQTLNAVSHMIRVQSSTDILAERLRTLEHKIDQMMDAVSHNSTGQ